MKKFLLKLLLVLPILILIIGTNWKLDPAHLFGRKILGQNDYSYEREIVALLLKGENVTGYDNYDERLVQRFYIQGSLNNPEVIVLGSSRALGIHQSIFFGKKFFNHGVSGATLEDYIAILSAYDQKGSIPSEIVMSLDPWIFNVNNNQKRWQSLKDDYVRLFGVIQKNPFSVSWKITSWVPAKALELFSLSYFQEAWSSRNTKVQGFALKDSNQKFVFKGTGESMNQGQTLLRDGSRTLSQNERLMSLEEIQNKVVQFISAKEIYGLDHFFVLDSSTQKNFESLIRWLKQQNVKIVFFLPPYHPKVYQFFVESPRHQIVEDVEQYLRKIGRDNQIMVLGSYNPKALNVHGGMFTDGMHFQDYVAGQIFERYGF
jgi:hypothetical protein